MDLVRASEALERARDAATWAAWGGALPLGAYLALVERLRNHPWPRRSMATWVLRDGAGTPVASCQAYRMDSRHRGTPGHAYGLGSVFTDPPHRGRGFATLLLDRLAERLALEDPSAQACLLFAEDGTSPYLGAGFRERAARSRSFVSRPGDPAAVVDGLIPEEDLPAAATELSWPEGPFSLRASPAQVDWQVERERILLEVAGRPAPPTRGARAGRGLALWTADPHSGALAFLAFQAEVAAEAEALVEAARRTAAACALSRALLWDRAEALLPEDDPGPGNAIPGLRPLLRPLVQALGAADWARIPGALRI